MTFATLRQAASSIEALHESWRRVRESKGAPGLDGETTDRFAEHLENNLEQLADGVARGTYSPGVLRRIAIPKATGGHRMLAIPNVRDRIVQTAAAIWLDARFEPVFRAASYAYRPNLGARRAADQLARLVSSDSWAVIADIEKFFDNVEHDLLGSDLRTAGLDHEDISLILQWISTQSAGHGGRFIVVKGLPQGAPLSPVLSNLFLTPFDKAIESAGFRHVRYADDFVIVSPNEAEARRGLELTRESLGGRGLSLKTGKTDVVPLSATLAFLSFEYDGKTRRIARPKIEEFQAHIGRVLGTANKATLSEMRRELQNVVTGWYNYFGGASPEIDRQLAQLDASLYQELINHAARLGLNESASAVLVGAITGRDVRPVPPAGYPDPAESASTVDHLRFSDSAPPATWMFSKRYAIASQAIAADQAPILSDRGHLSVPTHGSFLTKSGEVLTLKRKKAVVLEVPLDELSAVTIEGAGVSISTKALQALADARIPLTVCRPSGLPIARLVAARSWQTASVVEQQLAARRGKQGLAIAAEMISAKIANQRALLLYWSKYQQRGNDLRRILRSTAARLADFVRRFHSLLNQPTPNLRSTIFLNEARAAGHYWSCVAKLVPAMAFPGRKPRGSSDIINSALNYGYWMLRNEVWNAIERTSLSPFIGVLHAGRQHSAALAYDLMEEFRQPVVDRAVIAMIGKGTRLVLDRKGRFTLRSRRLLRVAINRTLERVSASSPVPLRAAMSTQAGAVQMAILHGYRYRGYRMPW